MLSSVLLMNDYLIINQAEDKILFNTEIIWIQFTLGFLLFYAFYFLFELLTNLLNKEK